MRATERIRIAAVRLVGGSPDDSVAPSVPGWPTIIILLAIPAVLLVASIVAFLDGIATFYEISREPSITLEGPALTGIQSNLGVLIMWSGAAIALFSAIAVRRLGGGRTARFLLWGGIITALLALDDFLLLHDEVFVEFLGQSERRVFLVYAVIVGLFLWHYRRVIMSSGAILLIIAVGCLGASLLVDQTSFLWGESPWRIFVEDGLKLVGLTFWTGFFVRCSYHALVSRIGSGRTSP